MPAHPVGGLVKPLFADRLRCLEGGREPAPRADRLRRALRAAWSSSAAASGLRVGRSGERRECPRSNHRIVVARELEHGVTRDRVLPGRAIDQAARPQEPQPVGPIGALRHRQRKCPRVVRDRLGRDGLRKQITRQLGQIALQSHLLELRVAQPLVAAQPKRGLNAVGCGATGIVQRVDVGPEVAVRPDAMDEKAHEQDHHDQAADPQIKERRRISRAGSGRRRRPVARSSGSAGPGT